jgi:hypothetical protein
MGRVKEGPEGSTNRDAADAHRPATRLDVKCKMKEAVVATAAAATTAGLVQVLLSSSS